MMANTPVFAQVLGDMEGFKRAVKLVTSHVSFNKCTTVQVFEATIR